MMVEYIKREDVLTIIKTSIFDLEYSGENDELQEEIKTIPAADVVKVVRCKDCKYFLQTDDFEYWCNGFCSSARLVRKEDFCSHGEYLNG